MKHTFSTYVLIMVLMVIGGGIVVINSNWMVLVGLFLWTWGNNIDIQGKF